MATYTTVDFYPTSIPPWNWTAAIQLIKNIEQRKQTITRVCESIIRRQTDFLDRGIDHLRPMMIKEVAEEVGVHPSTVSRALSDPGL